MQKNCYRRTNGDAQCAPDDLGSLNQLIGVRVRNDVAPAVTLNNLTPKATETAKVAVDHEPVADIGQQSPSDQSKDKKDPAKKVLYESRHRRDKHQLL